MKHSVFLVALAYLLNGEYPELFKLRIEMLLENNCDALAENLCAWCVKSPVFSTDLFVWQTHLMLLQRLDKQDEFVNQVQRVLDVTQQGSIAV